MSFTSTELAAIKHFCETNAARPLMTIYPTARIQVKETGEVIERSVHDLVADLKAHRKERARQRQREQREAKR